MATTIHYPSEASTIDVLWNILNQQSDSVKKALLIRLNQSLSNKETNGYKSMNEALAYANKVCVGISALSYINTVYISRKYLIGWMNRVVQC